MIFLLNAILVNVYLFLEVFIEELEVELVRRDGVIQPGSALNGFKIFVFDIYCICPEFLKFGQGKFVVGSVLEFNIEFQIVHKAGLSKVAGAGYHSADVFVTLDKGHDIQLGVDVLRWVGFNLQLTVAKPFQELVYPLFEISAILRTFHLIGYGIGKFLFRLSVGEFKGSLHWRFRFLNEAKGLFTCAYADEDPDSFCVFQRLVEGIEAAGVEIANQSIKKPGVFYEYPESFTKIPFSFVGDKSCIGSHDCTYSWKRSAS